MITLSESIHDWISFSYEFNQPPTPSPFGGTINHFICGNAFSSNGNEIFLFLFPHRGNLFRVVQLLQIVTSWSGKVECYDTIWII